MAPDLTAALSRVEKVLRDNLARFPAHAFPYVSAEHRYTPTFGVEIPWTAGFWPGQLLIMYTRTGDERYLERARGARALLEQSLQDHPDRTDHDLGFQFFLAAAADAELTGSSGARDSALRAAHVLSARFNRIGRFIPAHGPADDCRHAHRFIVDCLMNLPLLWWAGRVTGSTTLLEVASAHVETSVRLLLREDGSTFQAYDVDPLTGEPVGPATLQGLGPTSHWSRGQAWAIYGLAVAAAATNDERLLHAAERAADYFLAALGDECIAPWDFDCPDAERTLPDASASAVAAAGLLQLDQVEHSLGVHNRVQEYGAAARQIVGGLELRAATDPAAGDEGLILLSAYHVPAGLGINECTAWGDYFYLEALHRIGGGRGLYELV